MKLIITNSFIKVQIPGLDQPISLSLASGNTTGLSTHGNNLLVSGGGHVLGNK